MKLNERKAENKQAQGPADGSTALPPDMNGLHYLFWNLDVDIGNEVGEVGQSSPL